MSEMKLPAQVDIKLDPYNKNRILVPKEHVGFVKECLERSPIEDSLRARIGELEEALLEIKSLMEKPQNARLNWTGINLNKSAGIAQKALKGMKK